MTYSLLKRLKKKDFNRDFISYEEKNIKKDIQAFYLTYICHIKIHYLYIYLNTGFTVSIFDDKLFASKHKSVSVFKILRPQIDYRTIGRTLVAMNT